MKTWTSLTGLIVVAGMAARAEAQGNAPAGWLTDFVVAKDLARKTGKPMMVVFRCGP